MQQEDNEYDNCDFEESTEEQNAQSIQQSKNNRQQLKASLESMSVEDLVKLMTKQKSEYDSNREQFMRLTQQSDALKKGEKTLQGEIMKQKGEQERSLQVTKYTKSMVQLKCTFKRMMAQYKLGQTQTLRSAFVKMRVNASKRAMEENMRCHQVNINLNHNVMANIKQRFARYQNSGLRSAFALWKQTCHNERIVIMKDQFAEKIIRLQDQLAQVKEVCSNSQSQGQELNIQYERLKQKLQDVKVLQQKAELDLAKRAQDPKEIAAQYAEKVKKSRVAKRGTASQMSNRDAAKKEQMKIKLQEQYAQEKRSNRQLKEKLEQTELGVQQFLNEMGSMIDHAETDQDVDLILNSGVETVQNPGSAAATSAGGAASQTLENRNIQPSSSGPRINGGGGSNRVQRASGQGSQRYGQQQYGGSGESTGGSARHF